MRTLLNNLDLTTTATKTGKQRHGKDEWQIEYLFACNSASTQKTFILANTECHIDYGESYILQTGGQGIGTPFPLNFYYDSSNFIEGHLDNYGDRIIITIRITNSGWYGNAKVRIVFYQD